MTRLVHRYAVISPDGAYRYELTRRWGKGGVVCWIMLNPSVADAVRDDNTISKCIEFSDRWGYGQITVVNQCALRSTDPTVLKDHPDPSGPLNKTSVRTNVAVADLVVAAWGANPIATPRGLQLVAGPARRDQQLGEPLRGDTAAEGEQQWLSADRWCPVV